MNHYRAGRLTPTRDVAKDRAGTEGDFFPVPDGTESDFFLVTKAFAPEEGR
jgi:hypothetical protein